MRQQSTVETGHHTCCCRCCWLFPSVAEFCRSRRCAVDRSTPIPYSSASLLPLKHSVDTQETSAIAEKPTWRHVAGYSMHCLRNIHLRTIVWPWNWGVGVTQGHRKCHHSIAWVWFPFWFYSNYGRISHRFRDTPTYWSKIAQFSHSLIVGAPVRGEAARVKQRPSVTKNWNDEAMRW